MQSLSERHERMESLVGRTMMDTGREVSPESACAWMCLRKKPFGLWFKGGRGGSRSCRRPWPKQGTGGINSHLGNWRVLNPLVIAHSLAG